MIKEKTKVSSVTWMLDNEGNAYLSPIEIINIDVDHIIFKEGYEPIKLNKLEKETIKKLYTRAKLVCQGQYTNKK